MPSAILLWWICGMLYELPSTFSNTAGMRETILFGHFNGKVICMEDDTGVTDMQGLQVNEISLGLKF